jgi:hypothetical protein
MMTLSVLPLLKWVDLGSLVEVRAGCLLFIISESVSEIKIKKRIPNVSVLLDSF